MVILFISFFEVEANLSFGKIGAGIKKHAAGIAIAGSGTAIAAGLVIKVAVDHETMTSLRAMRREMLDSMATGDATIENRAFVQEKLRGMRTTNDSLYQRNKISKLDKDKIDNEINEFEEHYLGAGDAPGFNDLLTGDELANFEGKILKTTVRSIEDTVYTGPQLSFDPSKMRVSRAAEAYKPSMGGASSELEPIPDYDPAIMRQGQVTWTEIVDPE